MQRYGTGGATRLQMLFGSAVRADALEKILHLAKFEALRIIHYGNVGILQTIGLVAFLAIEMAVQFLHFAGMVVMAEAVFGGAAPVLGLVHQMVLGEKGEGSEDGGLVHAFQFGLQIRHTESVVVLRNDTKNKDSNRCRSYSVFFE